MTLFIPSTLEDFVNTYDEVGHDDWDPEADTFFDEDDYDEGHGEDDPEQYEEDEPDEMAGFNHF